MLFRIEILSNPYLFKDRIQSRYIQILFERKMKVMEIMKTIKIPVSNEIKKKEVGILLIAFLSV